jgi:adenosyl cobinamide kinase/adenosyl cobinamide phosphate guanylyltransferase
MPLTFLLGGARSGKSAIAVRLASATGRRVTYVATAEARDDEMAERIAVHRERRPAGWTTIEEPLDLEGAFARVPDDETVVVDCLSLWVSNAFEASLDAGEILRRARSSADVLRRRGGASFCVSNEVGLGIVPMHPVGRAYRDALGTVNAAWADAADRALFVVAGRALALVDVAEGAGLAGPT